jgi:hypothetical protein
MTEHGSAGALVEEITKVYGLRIDPTALVMALRAAVLVLAMADRQRPLVVTDQGMNWLCAFTGTGALAEFGAARGEANRTWSYVTVSGAALLDRWLPAIDRPCGIAVDLGGVRPVLFPPVRGVVGGEVALG